MASVEARKNKKGEITGYRVRICIGRDEHYKQVWRTRTFPRPVGLTPKKEEKEVQRIADAWEQEQREEYERNKNRIDEERRTVKEKITLISFIDTYWMNGHVKNGKHTPDTVAFYINMSNDIKSYIKDTNPVIKLSQFGKSDVLDYLTFLRTKAKTKKGAPISATTVQHCYNTLRNILEYAVYIEFIQEDPCRKIKPEDRPRSEDREIDFLDEDAAIQFMACLDSDKERKYWEARHRSPLFFKCLVNMLITTGLRRGELVGLQWKDLDTKKMLFRIRRNVTKDTSNKEEKDPAKKIHVGITKGKTVRKVPVSRYVFDLLLEYKAEQEKNYPDLASDSYIFCRANDTQLPIYPTEPTRIMNKFIKRHDLPNMSPHDLRHTAASLAIEGGSSVKEIQALLGHKDAATTLKFYAGISDKTKRGTVDRIDSMLRQKEKEDEE